MTRLRGLFSSASVISKSAGGTSLSLRARAARAATIKGPLVGSTCTYCSDSVWEVLSKNIP